MTNTHPGLVFVHGASHNADTWTTVLPLLRERGLVAEALDLPGAGLHAQNPPSFDRQPLDPAVFATEPSPSAGVTQDERTAAVLALVEDVAARSSGQVVLVGHSLGGLTITPVTQARPDLIAAVVYVTALMLPSGVSAIANSQDPKLPQGENLNLLAANPFEVGAARMDVRSADPTFRTAFYGDADDDAYEQATARLHADEPISVFTQAATITPERFGTVPRHYVRTTEDRVTVLAAQDYMIANMDAAMPIPTTVHTLHTSHSPFASQPQALAEILVEIAG